MLIVQIILGILLAFCLLAAMPMVLEFISDNGPVVLKALYLLIASMGVPVIVAMIAHKNGPEAMSHAFLLGALIQFAILFYNKEQFRKIESNIWVTRIGDLVYYMLVMCGSILLSLFASAALMIFWNQSFHNRTDLPHNAIVSIVAAVLITVVYITHKQTKNRLEILLVH